MDQKKEYALKKHAAWKGKLSIECKCPITNKEELAVAYTPGVAEPCLEIQKDEHLAYTYTGKGNTVAVITDGTAVLGLGDIGPSAGMPVMEGKCALFKAFAGIDAVPICINSKDPDEIVNTVYPVSYTHLDVYKRQNSMCTRSVSDVVINAHWKRIRFLEDHTDLLTQLVDIHGRVEDLTPLVTNVPGDLHARNQIVHAVQRFEKRGLTAAGRSDQCRNALCGDVNMDIFERLRTAVPQAHIFYGDDIAHFLHLSPFFIVFSDQRRRQIDQQRQHHQNRGNRESHLELALFLGVNIERYRQRRAGLA